MVQFPGSRLRKAMCSPRRCTGFYPYGLPHSATPGSQDVCSSPGLFAAYHGLPRRPAPRHPPWTLSRLTIFSLHPSLLAPGIHPHSPRKTPPLRGSQTPPLRGSQTPPGTPCKRTLRTSRRPRFLGAPLLTQAAQPVPANPATDRYSFRGSFSPQIPRTHGGMGT
jgi:hypothetical protein